ncbi:unnamed protein product [Camellia sinensis]
MELRFLIVLDDICTNDDWLKFVRPFADAVNGSRVIITTHDSKVASEVDPWSHPLNLMQLTEEDTWALFLNKAVPENSSENNLNNAKLWVAEGFVQTSNEPSIDSQDMAMTCLKELEQRNMIEIAERKSDGSPKTCRMPCFLYNIFLPKAEDIGFLHVHRLNSYCTLADSHIIRRIAEGVYKPSLPEKLGQYLKNLRYIGLRWTGLHTFPESIGDLQCLETLDLKYTNITTLPSSIWKAKSLQHLYMTGVSVQKPSLKESSTSTSKLETLTGLVIGSEEESDEENDNYRLDRFTDLPFGQPSDLVLSPLKDRQTQSKLHLFGLIKDGIQNLPINLEILTLSMSELRKGPMRVLGKLPRLNILNHLARAYVGEEIRCRSREFRELRVLKLWMLENLTQWTVRKGALPQLVELEIRGCDYLENIEGLKELPELKELMLTNMPQEFVSDLRENLDRDIVVTNDWKSFSLALGLVIGSEEESDENDNYRLDRFTALRKLGLTCHSKSVEKTVECISLLDKLETLKLRSRGLPFGQPSDLVLSSLKDHQTLSKLHLFGLIKDEIHNLSLNLKILTLSMSELTEDPMHVLGKLRRLNILNLLARAYVGTEIRCLSGEFCELRVLKLWMLENLTQWTVRKGALPQLVEIEIRGCDYLENVEGLKELPELKELILTNMPQVFVVDLREKLDRDIVVTNEWKSFSLACKCSRRLEANLNCRSLINRLEVKTINHIYREENTCVGNIANQEIPANEEIHIFQHPPHICN